MAAEVCHPQPNKRFFFSINNLEQINNLKDLSDTTKNLKESQMHL
jgi:hypothetical protein